MTTLNYDSFPNPECAGGVKRYIEKGVPPGSFLTAVLCNDLRTACEHADHVNQRLLFDIVHWLYNNAPRNCWGSASAYDWWVQNGGIEGLERKARQADETAV